MVVRSSGLLCPSIMDYVPLILSCTSIKRIQFNAYIQDDDLFSKSLHNETSTTVVLIDGCTPEVHSGRWCAFSHCSHLMFHQRLLRCK